MHWYEGSIAEAVNLSKQRNAIFVVFVEGDNELSVEMASTIDDGDVLKRLSDAENFLAIKLKSGSSSYTHFAQIYQFVPVPSLFFIGRNGTPLEVVCAGVEPDNLANRIDRILEEHHKEKPNPCPSTSGDNKQQTVNFLQTEGAANAKTAAKHDAQPENSTGPPAKVPKQHIKEVTASGKQYDVVCDGEVCVRVRKDDAGPSGAPATAGQQAKTTPLCSAVLTGSTSSMEEKMEKAKELIEARKREKAAKEKEAEKQKEMERRAQGQGVAELKKWQADQELKQIQEERKREKLENNLARQRILEQIAQDRAERRARDQPPPAAQPQVSRPAPTSGDVSSRARIQFKLPDGSSHTAHFDAGGTLAEVHTYVSDNLQLSTSRFALWTAFPRHELTDPSATLRQLQLTPSAALLVLPRREHAAVTPPSTFATIITVISQLFTSLILEPSQQFYNWIYARLYPNTPGERPRNDPPAPPRGGTTPPNAGTTPPRGGITPPVRRRGNIHRLGEERSGEDDNNTWNGNSTQQM